MPAPAAYSGSCTAAKAFRLLRRVYYGSSTAAETGRSGGSRTRRHSGSSGAGSSVASPAAQLPEYNPSLFHVPVHGLHRVKAKVPFPQFLSTIAEISPTTSFYLLWKCQRGQTQSLCFIISSEVHIAFGRDIRYNIIKNTLI